MLEYPSFDGKFVDEPITAHPKYDGSNMRVEWTRKDGFAKFGTRHSRLDETTDPILSRSIPIWQEKYEEIASEVLRKYGAKRATLFGELFGPNSFAGYHDPADTFDVMLYDAAVDDNGIMPQTEFLKLFRGADVAPVIYKGKANEILRAAVKAGEFRPGSKHVKALPPGAVCGEQSFEGVVCKGGRDKRGNVIMFKIKSDGWYDKLRLRCAGDEALFKKLA